MSNLEAAIVDAFIRENPIRMELSNGPVLYANFNDLREMVCSMGQCEEQFLLAAAAIAKRYECVLNSCEPDFFIIVRQPSDLRMGTKIDAEKIFGNIETAQREMYEVFAPLIAISILDHLHNHFRELNKYGLLPSVLVDLNIF